MQVDILCIGSIKNNLNFFDICNQYKNRVKRKINIIELKTLNLPKEKKLISEKNQLVKFLKDYDYTIILDRNGRAISSEEFSKEIENKMINGYRKICFVIGSDLGLDNYFVSNYDSISFGKQTWPHLLIRIMLMEQIYRAFEIIKGSNYHK
ncbi:MAG: Ribosomal RNA large subunit methyltransferase H [Alphaproteobacteria bacterium MarineAlpha8_Bin1]|nr:MAG: Ribosomal RNA large subunit methyltransferase H [Alphaproteobacteria bacterium MarineAlpha8_Bin1]|tara:strand:- start:781 stop:1233 length:453 start_codon:yes stop_codon:yes gene_type:complete